MREDQAQRLAELDELLVEQFILEADPRNWPGYGKMPIDLTRDERGDSQWTRRCAVGTAATLRSLHDLTDRHLGNQSKDPETQEKRDDDLDKHISKYEAEAAKLLDKVQAVGRK